MTLVSSIAIYFVIWWLVLFVVLPFGVQSQDASDQGVPGADRGAPQQPLLLRKALATTLLSAIIFAGVYFYFGYLDMTLEDLIP
jgi:predicted secreted protein